MIAPDKEMAMAKWRNGEMAKWRNGEKTLRGSFLVFGAASHLGKQVNAGGRGRK
jgi:hypothetical protein